MVIYGSFFLGSLAIFGAIWLIALHINQNNNIDHTIYKTGTVKPFQMTWGPCTTGAASLTAFSLIITTIICLFSIKSTRDNHECFFYARETYLPSPVLMISISPSLMKIGTCTTRPVSNVAGFVTLEAVSPLIPALFL